jgi:prepilin-type processing-associated H-X9-DG protein
VLDGLSNTLLFGEGIFGYLPADLTNRVRAASWMGVGSLTSGWNNFSNKGEWYTFSSRHPGVVQFCLADGSVRPLRVNISRDIRIGLAGRSEQYIANLQ